MMSALQELYQQVILDHNRAPRNFRKLESPTQVAEGYNPLCGDRVSVEVRVEGDRIRDIAFQGSGCAISRASASMMTAHLKGKTLDEASQAFEQFHGMLTGEQAPPDAPPAPGKLAAFAGVREFPIRIKCATLPWHVLRAALAGRAEPVSTE
jgi:nitrogen fixation NifU-like protein